MTLTDCTLSNNTGVFGSAIYSDSTYFGAANCELSGHDSSVWSVYDTTNESTWVNCIFYDNDPHLFNSGGVTQLNCLYYGNDRAIEILDGTNSIISGTITNNAASSGKSGGVWILNGSSTNTIVNSVFWGNTDSDGTTNDTDEQIFLDTGASATVTYSLIDDGTPGGGIPFGGGSNNNIDDDPNFADSGSDDYRLTDDSPAIGTGSDSDYGLACSNDADCEIVGAGACSSGYCDGDLLALFDTDRFCDHESPGSDDIDMGAIEYSAHGDVNSDGVIDQDDIDCVIEAYLGNYTNCTVGDADIITTAGACSTDSTVDLVDVLAVSQAAAGSWICCE